MNDGLTVYVLSQEQIGWLHAKPADADGDGHTDAWERIAIERGFDVTTVQPCPGKGEGYILARPL